MRQRRRRARTLDDLPERLVYLKDVLSTFAMGEGLVSYYEDKINKITPKELDELVRVYEEIYARNDALTITMWLSNVSIDSRKFGSARPVVDLFFLFDGLRKRGLAPFISRRVELGDMFPPANESEIPSKFAYLVEPANQFGALVAENLREEWLAQASDTELGRLRALGKTIETERHLDEIFDWIARVGKQTNWTATRVTYLIELLRDANMLAE